MPKLIFLHTSGSRKRGWTKRRLERFGQLLRPLFAEACSTRDVPLTADNIDWVAQPYAPGSIASCSLELETFAYPDRVARLTEQRLIELKRQAVAIVEQSFVHDEESRELFGIFEDKKLIWLKYQDQRGHHI